MACHGCKGETAESTFGPWCSSCGGVVLASGKHYVRHVATAKGPGGEFQILWDETTQDYLFIYYVKVKKYLEEKGEWVQQTEARVPRASLDNIIALVQPHAKGESGEWPTLGAAPSATDDERRIIDFTFEGANLLLDEAPAQKPA